MVVTDLNQSLPADLTAGDDIPIQRENVKLVGVSPGNSIGITDQQLKTFIVSSRRSLDTDRYKKKLLWDECWNLYRGKDTWTDKEEWQ